MQLITRTKQQIKRFLLARIPPLRTHTTEEQIRTAVVVWSVPHTEKVIALTFDDGPSSALTLDASERSSLLSKAGTETVLDTLDAHKIRATFFVVGEQLKNATDLLKRMSKAGHEVGIHGWTHKIHFTKLSFPTLLSHIEKVKEVLFRAELPEPALIRPPGGYTDPAISQLLYDRMNLRVIMWSGSNRDTLYKNNNQAMLKHFKKALKPGAIILMHDPIYRTGTLLPEMIALAQQNGYRFETVSELLKSGSDPERFTRW